MELRIDIKNKPTKIIVTYKDIKSVRLKVFPTREIKLSVPVGTPEEWINNYIESKRKWIEEKLQLFEQTKAIEKENNIMSGASTRILGRQRKIQVLCSKQKRVVLGDKEIQLYTNYPDDQEAINKQFNNWWQKSSKQCFDMQLCKLFPIIEKHGVQKPKIVVIACDASDNNKKRIINCCTYYGVEYYTTDLTGNELSKATGRRGLIACVGIIDINFSEAIKNILNEQTKP